MINFTAKNSINKYSLMNFEEIRNHCINKKGVTEEFPFDESTLVFKVMGKMFALLDLDGEFGINLKCNPEYAIELREKYSSEIIPGYHMNKKYWNSVLLNGILTTDFIKELIDLSYIEVIKSLPKKVQIELANK